MDALAKDTLLDDDDSPSEDTPVPEGVIKRRSTRRVPAPQPEELKPARRTSQYEMMQRRQNVQRLRLRGLSISEIATQLKVSYLTAQRDLESVKLVNQEQVKNFQQEQFVGEAMTLFDELRQHAWNEFEQAQPGSRHRLQSLDMIRTLQNDKVKALQDTGLLMKVAHEVKHEHTIALPWTDEMKRAASSQLLQSQMTAKLALPTPDPNHDPGRNIIIDADVIEENK